MQFIPQRQNRSAQIAVFLLFFLALLGMLLSRYAPAYPGIWQLLALGCAVAAILLTQKYLVTAYLYILTPLDELYRTNTFSVIRTMGKKRTTVAKINLNHLIALLPAGDTDRYLREQGLRTAERATFCTDLFPPNAWTLIAESGEDLVAVTIQDTEGLIEELNRRITTRNDPK